MIKKITCTKLLMNTIVAVSNLLQNYLIFSASNVGFANDIKRVSSYFVLASSAKILSIFVTFHCVRCVTRHIRADDVIVYCDMNQLLLACYISKCDLNWLSSWNAYAVE